MKIAFTILICMSILFTFQIYAQEKEMAQAEPVMKLELLYKKEFGELMVGPEGFPPPEIKQILLDKNIPQEDKDWLLNSLRIEIARREKVLYANGGESIKLLDDLQSITTSKNLKYMIVLAAYTDYGGITVEDIRKLRGEWLDAFKKFNQWRAKYEKADENNKEMFKDSMYYWLKIRDDLEIRLTNTQMNTKEYTGYICMETGSGTVLWQKENMEPPRYISNDGRTVIGVPGYHFFNSAIFYDENGNEKTRIGGLYGPQGCHDMSADGKMFAAITRMNPSDEMPMAIAAFDGYGIELWRAEVKGTWPPVSPGCIAISHNHKYIAAYIRGTNLFNDNGDIIDTYECRTYKPGFSADDKYVMLGHPRDTIYFVQTNNGDVLWKKSLGYQPYSKPFVAKDGRAIFYTDGYLLNSSGNIVWQDKEGVMNPMGLSPNGYVFIPTTNPDVIIYYLASEAGNEDQ